MALTQEMIEKLRNIAANSTNEKARIGAKEKLEAIYTDMVATSEEITKSKASQPKTPKPKAERKKREPKAKVEVKSGTPYNCDDLIAKAEERKAKAKAAAAKRANEPKKTQATKNAEAIEKTAERVEKNVEKRVKKDDISFGEIKKLISEYEDAIAKLKALLAKAEGKMAKGGGVDAEEVEHILMKAKGVKEHHCGCGGNKMATGGGVGEKISEAEAKNKLMSLKEKGEIILRTGNHGQVFMSLKGGQLKSYDDYTEAFHNWVVAKSRNSQ